MKTNEHVAITVRSNVSYRIRRYGQVMAYRLLGPTIMARVYYRIMMKEKLDLNNPKTFTAKINWYKLNYCPKNDLVVQCSDKYRVRAFLKAQGLEKYLSNVIDSWENPEDINWDALPNRFALKNSNGCGYNVICDDKSFLDEKGTKKLLKKWLKEHFGYYNAEPHYEIGTKRIICESYIESGNLLPVDYKVHCMNGEAKVLQVCEERTAKTTKYMYYKMSGQPYNFGQYPQDGALNISADMLNEMKQICRKIAPYFPYVRIDFFVNAGKLQIGELTFSPSAGLKPDLKYGDGDRIMGEMLDIECIRGKQ